MIQLLANVVFEKADRVLGKDWDYPPERVEEVYGMHNRACQVYSDANIIIGPGDTIRERYGYSKETHKTWDEQPWRNRMLIALADAEVDQTIARLIAPQLEGK